MEKKDTDIIGAFTLMSECEQHASSFQSFDLQAKLTFTAGKFILG